MATATKEAAKEAKKVSAASVFRSIVLGKDGKVKAKLPEAESIIKQVKAQSGSKTFDERQCSWYLSMARQGKLTPKSWKTGNN